MKIESLLKGVILVTVLVVYQGCCWLLALEEEKGKDPAGALISTIQEGLCLEASGPFNPNGGAYGSVCQPTVMGGAIHYRHHGIAAEIL